MSEPKKTSFNVNAPAYVPNVNAAPYVPSFTMPPAAAQPAAQPQPQPQQAAPVKPLPAKSVSLPAKSVSLPAKSVSLPSSSAPAPKKEEAAPKKQEAAPKKEEAAPKKEEPKREEPKKEEPKKEEPKKEEPKKEEPKKEKVEEIEESPSGSASASYDLESELALLTAKEEGKEHMSIVFMGHVDAGKSTTAGHILVATGMVDKRTLEKYEREAKEKGRESWYLSWALDTNPEERDKGKTVEVGRASFETETKRYTILDAPGHKSYVPNMISGAAQADVGVLILSARKGEFESGFDKQGQTREHAMLAKTAGIRKLIIAVNKMDDPTVGWSKERYDEIMDKILPFLKQLGFNPKNDLEFLPISGFSGANLKDPLTPEVCSWYSGPSLIQLLDKMEKIQRKEDAPFRIPITEKFRDMGIVVSGKVEAGVIALNQKVLVMPNKHQAEIQSIEIDEVPVKVAKAGENVRLKLKGVEEEEVAIGFVLCHPSAPVHVASSFDAQIVILEYKNIICSGFSAVMHIHTLVEEITLSEIKYLVDRKTGKRTKVPPKFVKQGQAFIARVETKGPICIETHNDYPQLGRFTIRHDGKTIAMGKVLKLNTAPGQPAQSTPTTPATTASTSQSSQN